MNTDSQSIPPDEGWFTREKILTSFLAGVTLLLLYLCFEMLMPFLPALTFGLTLAVATQRPYNWLSSKVRNNTITSALAVLVVGVLLVLPAVSLFAYGLQSATETISSLNTDEGQLQRQSIEKSYYLGDIYHWLQKRFNFDDQVRSLSGSFARQATEILKGSFSLLSQAVITLFVLFFIYRDGNRAVYVFTKLIPLSHLESRSLVNKINDTILATVNGSFIVSLAQSAMACVMYYFLDVPGALLWGLATFFMAIVPVFGTFAVWGPISVFLFLTGSTIKGLVLLSYGILAIGTVDNILYPYLVGNRMRLHTVPTFFAVLGGITVFGASGVILGPIIVVVTFALLDVWWRRTLNGKAADGLRATTHQGNSDVRPAQLLESKK